MTITFFCRLTVKEAQDKFSKQQNHCMKVYKRHLSDLSIHKMTESKPVWPSLSEMLEMLTDSESDLFDLYPLPKFENTVFPPICAPI